MEIDRVCDILPIKLTEDEAGCVCHDGCVERARIGAKPAGMDSLLEWTANAER